jgi:hypothetical protein
MVLGLDFCFGSSRGLGKSINLFDFTVRQFSPLQADGDVHALIGNWSAHNISEAHALATRICGLNQFSDATYFYEMSKSLFTTLPPSDTFSQHFYGEVAADFPAVLEAVNNSLRCAVNTNGTRSIFVLTTSVRGLGRRIGRSAYFSPLAKGFFALKSMAIQIEAESSGRRP